ncbi:histidine kinase dimerization/phosphoacceptor domain-containing protein [Streptomyces diacarni]|uniref:histidine kinase dimerization/phosphoacceptor domain-containing protein n=1 Tax=Streptomyces diacarni TaxID=2800381 RepID=UPI001FECEB93|nr:histidine kinase dimerization/phosphoacceptor domain-containing protein [Streptomyces diacarni]
MGLIAVKAGVANHVVATRPEEARAALEVIEEVSRETLREMRTTLTVLRRPQEGGAWVHRPVLGLSELPALVRTVEAAGGPRRPALPVGRGPARQYREPWPSCSRWCSPARRSSPPSERPAGSRATSPTRPACGCSASRGTDARTGFAVLLVWTVAALAAGYVRHSRWDA